MLAAPTGALLWVQRCMRVDLSLWMWSSALMGAQLNATHFWIVVMNATLNSNHRVVLRPYLSHFAFLTQSPQGSAGVLVSDYLKKVIHTVSSLPGGASIPPPNTLEQVLPLPFPLPSPSSPVPSP